MDDTKLCCLIPLVGSKACECECVELVFTLHDKIKEFSFIKLVDFLNLFIFAFSANKKKIQENPFN